MTSWAARSARLATTSRRAAAGTRPRLTDIVALAGVLARSYSYRDGVPARLAALPVLGRLWRGLAAAPWVPLLLLTRPVTRARGRHAILLLEPPGTARRAGMALSRGVLLAAAVVLLEAGALLLTRRVSAAAGVPARSLDVVEAAAGGLVVVALAVAFGPLVARPQPPPLAAAAAQAAAQGDAEVLLVEFVAAWPAGQGHLRALLRAVLQEADARRARVVLHARTTELSRTYARYGFVPVPGREPLTMWRAPALRSPGRGA